MTLLTKYRPFIVWAEDIDPETYNAPTPEIAAEWFVEDVWDGSEGDVVCSVKDEEDETEYEVTVVVEIKKQVRAKS